MEPTDDVTALALAAGRGDRMALSEFIRRTQAEVWRFLARTAGAETADDLTQETYLRVVAGLAGFEGRASARAWLFTIARRVVVDAARHDATRPRLVGLDPTDLALLQAGPTDPSSDLRLARLLAILDPLRRDALVLTQLMGFSYTETAEICGCPVGTVRSRVARARADLVAALAPETENTAIDPAGIAGGRVRVRQP